MKASSCGTGQTRPGAVQVLRRRVQLSAHAELVWGAAARTTARCADCPASPLHAVIMKLSRTRTDLSAGLPALSISLAPVCSWPLQPASSCQLCRWPKGKQGTHTSHLPGLTTSSTAQRLAAQTPHSHRLLQEGPPRESWVVRCPASRGDPDARHTIAERTPGGMGEKRSQPDAEHPGRFARAAASLHCRFPRANLG